MNKANTLEILGFKQIDWCDFGQGEFYEILPIVPIGTMKTMKTFFFAFPALNSTAMIKKLKYSNSYLITTKIS